jgi:hypothetical protein
VLAQTQPLGLVPLLGSSPDVGTIGYTSGGGMGWLARCYGLSTDSVCSFEVVTAEGQIVRASHADNSDLFWCLRSGGGLGIVTGMEVQLYPVSTVYGGNLYYRIGQAKEVLTRYREWIATVSDELTSSIVIMNFPPIPELPDFLRGQSFAMVRGCYCGPVEEGGAITRVDPSANAFSHRDAPHSLQVVGIAGTPEGLSILIYNEPWGLTSWCRCQHAIGVLEYVSVFAR